MKESTATWKILVSPTPLVRPDRGKKSVQSQTGLHEFSIGPASDEPASGSPGEDKNYHRFHLVKGRFMSVDIQREGSKGRIVFRHHDVFGKVVYEWKTERMV